MLHVVFRIRESDEVLVAMSAHQGVDALLQPVKCGHERGTELLDGSWDNVEAVAS
jgi:hypothetical protein